MRCAVFRCVFARHFRPPSRVLTDVRLGPLTFPAASPARGRSSSSAEAALSGACDAAACRSLLGVPASAGEAAIRSAYRAEARKRHPDRGGSGESFQELQKCYEVVLSEARSIEKGKPEWLKKMKDDFANFSCC
mmetsp:Transcript_68668/g.174392  ORF Transcript_68668/g.174392 Transcript_68668/m.174392 type:complete len:134 (-) Transcript_68668:121-522(-)